MYRFLFMCLDSFIAALVMIPLFCVLNKQVFHNKNRSFIYYIFSIYLCGMFAVAGLPDIRYIRFDLHINTVPFAYMFSDYRSSLLNVLLFLPMGFSLPLLWQDYHPMRKTVLFGFCTSFLIETLQIFTLRATDVNDLMTNSAGTFLGWCIAKIILHYLPEIIPETNQKDLYILCAVTFLVMFFVHPFASEILFFFL